MATSEANKGGPYRVPRHDSGWRAFGLALATHALLFLFLWGGINWQSSEPVAVEAEVWDLTTQQAAPPPPPAEAPEPEPEPRPEPEPAPPPPAPAPPPPREVTPPKPDPEIALRKEREKKKKEEEKRIAEEKEELRKQKLADDRKLAEQKKKEDDRKKREEEEKERRLAEEKAEKKKEDDAKKKQLADKKAAERKDADRIAKLRAEEMRRITGAAGGSSGTAEKSTAPRLDSGYVAAITAKIKSNISYAGSQDVPGNPRAEFKITQLPTGEIVSVRKIKSSGIPAYDAAVENAISKSSPLPKKKDGTVERDINATFNLKDLP
ncbi:cell envelope integrity protein TolA [Pseudoduganella sp. SL102]|uniref:cell envelope integrity protein TolA n=1 Tax=Pseudoduganella sp. SL102 TaxID=2995154 RepID=UPI00248B320D|nr:cell envelope integrity protein TolA [Pseudoduganella sp. SL102]WBS04610.1 cell envelope integrity protein TolA [Pseudoduganella sp. SL102]